MFHVYDNDHLAEIAYTGLWMQPEGGFLSFDEAVDYANQWLGDWGPGDYQVDTPIDYSGYGDYIEIRRK